MEPNVIVKKNKQKELLDELITQMQHDEEKKTVESKPIEITTQVKEKMITLMDSYLSSKEKLTKINGLRKELTTQSSLILKDLETLMRLYGLNELIKGTNKFVLDRTVRKKPLKKKEFKDVIQYVLKDPAKVDQIYETAGQMSDEVVIEKLKCLKHKEKI